MSKTTAITIRKSTVARLKTFARKETWDELFNRLMNEIEGIKHDETRSTKQS